MTQSLRNWVYDSNGQPVVGADVYVYDASLLAGNPNSILSQTTTDPNGMYSVTGLTETAKDVRVVKSGKETWLKGFAKHNLTDLNVTGVFKLATMTTRGDLLVMDSTPTPARLAVGANKTILASNGSDPSWSAGPTLSGTLTVETALNVGTTGAASTEIKTGGPIKAGGAVYASGGAVDGIKSVANSSLAANGTLTLHTVSVSTGQALVFITDLTNGDNALCMLHGAGNAVTGPIGTATTFAGLGAWVFNGDSGTFWAVFYSGGSFLLRNRTAGARNVRATIIGYIG